MISTPRLSDAETIAKVICESIYACKADHYNDPQQIADWTANKTPENIKNWITQNFAVSFFDKDNVIGFALLSPKGELLLNYVLPNSQGKGVGKAMLDAIIQQARQQKMSEIYLESTKTAKDFYLSQGFILKNAITENGEIVAFEMVLPL